MNRVYDHIEELIERFFDGMTSKEEEQELYLFFSGKEVPPHLEAYQSVFRYFESGIAEELRTEKEKQNDITKQPSKRRWLIWAGVAAVVLFLLTIRSLFHNTSDFDPWEGSYIVRNGERITDIDLIRPELEATVRIALLQEEKAKHLLENLQEVSNEGIDVQQEINARYCQIISEFTDEKAREEVKKMLDVKCD